MYIYKLKLALGTFGKDYRSVLNVDENDVFSQLGILSRTKTATVVTGKGRSKIELTIVL